MVERELERVAGAVVAAAGRPLSQSQTVTEAMAGSAASGEVTRLTLYSSPVSPTDPGGLSQSRHPAVTLLCARWHGMTNSSSSCAKHYRTSIIGVRMPSYSIF